MIEAVSRDTFYKITRIFLSQTEASASDLSRLSGFSSVTVGKVIERLVGEGYAISDTKRKRPKPYAAGGRIKQLNITYSEGVYLLSCAVHNEGDYERRVTSMADLSPSECVRRFAISFMKDHCEGDDLIAISVCDPRMAQGLEKRDLFPLGVIGCVAASESRALRGLHTAVAKEIVSRIYGE